MSVVDLRRTNEAPTNIHAEQALIGAVLYDNAMMAKAASLRPDQFAGPLHPLIWSEIRDAVAAGKFADPVTLAPRLEVSPEYENMGGLDYLVDLLDHGAAPSVLPQLVDDIVEAWAQRQIIDVARAAQSRVAQREGNALSILSELRGHLEQLEGDAAPDDSTLISASDATNEVLAALDDELANGKPRGAMTGLRCVDRRMGGLKPGWLVVIGARPSMGKTALARAIAWGCAERNPTQQVAFFAIEMERREIIERALSAHSYLDGDGIPYQDIGNGKVAPLDMMRLRKFPSAPRNLVIDDQSVVSLEYIRRRVWALKRRGPLAAIVIDYLQLMQLPPRDGRNDAALWGVITSGLKRLARETKVCVVLLSQLSRQVEGRDDKRPQLSDLRESGSIEQDANAVLFPYREFYYVQRAEPKPGGGDHLEWEMRCEELRTKLDVIAAKVRQGAIGTDHQTYLAEFDHIEDVRAAHE